MNPSRIIPALTFALALAYTLGSSRPAPAAEKDDHDHDHEHVQAGPTGGRILTNVEPHAEFFVNADDKVEIRFVDHDNKIVAPGDQVVTVILGSRTSPTRLAFTIDGDKLVSDKKVPSGNNHPTVVQIRESKDKDAKTATARFNLDRTQCPTCDYAEYACICDHDHDHSEDAPKK